jgi:septal ring factor EnvC (AmiA/AmiB activator)
MINKNKYRDNLEEAELITKIAWLKEHNPEAFSAQQIEVPVEKIVEKPVEDPALIKKIDELLKENKELKDKLADSLNCQAEVKRECEECKQRLTALITENTKQNKEIEKYKKDNIKLKKALEQLSQQE